MIHEDYTGKIGEYVSGIERDLENVTANEGHDLVKDSIMEQARRIADYAVHNRQFLVSMMDEFLEMMENRHGICQGNVTHEQLMKGYEVYLKWGLDAVSHFDDEEEGDASPSE